MRGAFRRPPKVVQGVPDSSLQGPAKILLSSSLCLYLHILGLAPPLLVSPPGLRMPPGRPKKRPKSLTHRCWTAFFSIFCPSKLHSTYYIEKNQTNAGKIGKSMIFALPKRSQTVSKTIANRCPKKHVIFEASCDRFLQHLKPRNLENINFP